MVEFDADTAALGFVLEALAAAGVTAFTAAPPSLEELFLRHYGEQPAGQAKSGQQSQVQ